MEEEIKKLQKEEEENFDIFSKMIENYINTDTKTISNLLEKIDKLQKENERLKQEIKIPIRQYGKTYKQIKEHENNLSNERIKNLKEFLKNDMLNEKDINDLLVYIERLENITITYFKIICNGGKNE